MLWSAVRINSFGDYSLQQAVSIVVDSRLPGSNDMSESKQRGEGQGELGVGSGPDLAWCRVPIPGVLWTQHGVAAPVVATRIPLLLHVAWQLEDA